MITDLCLFHLMTRRSPAGRTNPRELLVFPLLVPACLLLDGPADLPQMLPEGV